MASTTGDDGLIGIAVKEGENHFVSDPGQRCKAILTTGSAPVDSGSGVAVFIILAIAVPREAYFHPAEFSAMDFFAFRSRNNGDLRAVHQ